MSKRGAIREMNHDNWDQEDEPEEAGVFRQASRDVMKQRPVKKAKRRAVTGQTDDGEDAAPGVTVFKGFTGFASSGSKPTFSFNKDTSKPLGGLSNGGSAPFSLKGPSMFGAPKTDSKPEAEKAQETATNGSTTSRSKYLQQLRALNESVNKWITEHVNKNPHCVLTPIFKDYEKHLAEVEKLNPDQGSKSAPPASKEQEEKSSPVKTTAASPPPTFSFAPSGSGPKPTNSSSGPSVFGGSTLTSTSTGPSLFGGPAASSTTGFGSGFSFKPTTTTGDAKPFSFATGSTSAPAASKEAEDEEYVPPKAEVKEIQEEDSTYSKRCKLYYQKSGAWTERGVGNLHLKPCGEKTQLVIRADTNLGNILLNIMLSKSIPLARQGKNNVSMMCVVNPPIDPKETDGKPTSLLIRVKTGEEADELLEKLQENQK